MSRELLKNKANVPDNLSQQAIQAAIHGRWAQAVRLNLQLLGLDPEDSEAHLRLARAYLALGQKAKAQKQLAICLKQDPFNNIARQLQHKAKQLTSAGERCLTQQQALNPEAFIEIPGQTHLCQLTHLTNISTLNRVSPGDPLCLRTHPHSISVVLADGTYLGRLDDLSCMKAKKLLGITINTCSVVVKTVGSDSVEVMIRPASKNADNNHC